MRSDVKTLLDRLGKSDFNYREFADRFSELETWPVFEAVLRDSRVHTVSVARASYASPEPDISQRQQSPVPLGAALTRKYGGQPRHAGQQEPQDVRSLLTRISTAVSKGTI